MESVRQQLCVCRHTKSNWEPRQPPFRAEIQSHYALWGVETAGAFVDGTMLPQHLNNYVTVLEKEKKIARKKKGL